MAPSPQRRPGRESTGVLRYEHRTEPLLPRRRFLHRLGLHAVAAGGILMGSLTLGVAGYHYLARLPWIDALLNASMILAGMGPVDAIPSAAAKIFASFYALFSGVVLLATAGLLVAPVAHRLLHGLHLEAGDDAGRD
jgi:hypothetical protein